MENLNSLTLTENVNSPKKKVWELLFNRFGEVHIYNPNLKSSHYLKGESGELGCERHCSLDGKTFVQERIVEVNGEDSFVIQITDSNFPMMKEMHAKMFVNSISEKTTKIKFVFYYSTSPKFMGGIMGGIMKKKLKQSLIGMKYYLETNIPVSNRNFKNINKKYKQLALNAAFSN